MAKLTINVQLNSAQVKTSLNDLKSQMSTIVTELNKISVSKDLTAQINSLAKLYKEMASAAKEAYKTTTAENDKAEQSATKTANALAKLTEQYGKLNAKLTEAKTKSTATDYSELEKQIQANSEAVKNLNDSFKTNKSLSKEQKQSISQLTVECGEFSSTVDVMVAKDKELAKALKDEEKAAKEAAKAEREAEEAKEESTTSTNKTINAVESLRKQYADLLNTLKTLNQQYKGGTFDKTEEELRSCYTQVQELSQSLKENEEVSEEQQKQLAELQTSYKTLAADVSAAKEATDKLKSTEPLQPNYTSTINQVQKGYAQLLQTIKNTEKYYKKGTFSTYKTQIEQALPAVEQLNTANQQTNTLTAEQQAQLEQLATALELLKSEYQTTAATQKNFHGTLKDIVSGFVNFQASAMLVMKPLQLIRSALSSINETLVETEDAIIEIQRVLNETISNSEVSSELYDLAKEYGQTFSNVAEIAQNFVKSGLSWDEAIEATEAALLALNVAELDAEEASEGLIAIMTQFGYTASDLTDIVDILNKTADNAAVTTEELLEALQKTGSYAAAANLSLEETVAIITALSEATAASGSNLGTSLKSLLAYTTKSSSLSVFSQLSDDMANVVSLYQVGKASILDIWEQLSVEMQSLTAEQADLLSQWSEDTGLEDELANELSEIYDSLTGVYDTAGTYRKNYFIALLNNMDEVEEALDNLTDAAGYSAEENETYLESYTAKLNTLQATWESLISDEEGWLTLKKGLVDIGQAALNAVDYVGGLSTVLTGVATAMQAAFGTKVISSIINKVKSWETSIKSSYAALKQLKTQTDANTASQTKATTRAALATAAEEAQAAAVQANTRAKIVNKTYTDLLNSGTASEAELNAAATAAIKANTLAEQANAKAATTAAAATTSLATAINTLFVGIGLVATIYQVVTGIIDSYNEKQEEARQAAIDAWEAVEDEAISLMELYSQLVSLTDKTELTADEQEELTEVTESLVDALGYEAEILGNLTDSSDDYLQKLKELTQEKLKYYAITAQAASNAAKTELETLGTKYEKTYKGSANRDLYSDIFDSSDLPEGVNVYSVGGDGNYITFRVDNGDAYSNYETLKEFSEWLYDNGYGETDLFTNVTTELSTLEDRLDSITNSVAYSDVLNALYSGATVTTEEEFNNLVNEIMEANGITESYRSTVESLVSTYFGYTAATEDATEATNELADAIASLSDTALENLVEALEAARDAQEESLELAEKQLAVKEAEEALENAKNQRSVRTLNAETGQWEYVANQSDVEDAEADLQDAIDALNEYVEEQAWDSVIDELESGNATTDSILEILNTWLGASDYDGETPSWLDSIIGIIENAVGEDISGNGVVGSYDSGGIASGLGFMAKATNLPESVNDPELTSKILSPVSNAQFDKYVQDMGLLFETARRYDNQSNNATIQAMGNTTNNSTDNSITINGVTLGSDMGNRSLNDIISMLSLIPNH